VGKVTRPTLPEVYAREKLFKTLDRLRQQPVIWISGPGGSGKTTLVSSYLDSRNLSCLWYQLDEGDKDPATFFYYLSKAAKKAFPHKKSSLPLLHPTSPGISRRSPNGILKNYLTGSNLPSRLFLITSMKFQRKAVCLKSSFTVYPASRTR
jgi:hypothetical protein